MQRFGKSVKDLIKTPTVPAARPVTDIAQKKRTQPREQRIRIEPMTAQDHASNPRLVPRLSAEARDIRDTLGEKTVKRLLAGDLHPKKLKAGFSTLEKANLGHVAKADAVPPMPAMPKVAVHNPRNVAAPPVKVGASFTSPSGSSVSVANPSSPSHVNGAPNAPAGANPSSPPAPRSRETLAKGREGADTEARQHLQRNERSRSQSLGR